MSTKVKPSLVSLGVLRGLNAFAATPLSFLDNPLTPRLLSHPLAIHPSLLTTCPS